VGSFPGFRMGNTRACFRTGGKYCLRRTALNTFVRKVIARFGRCLRTLFGTPFGPGALPTLSPLMALTISEGVVNVGSLVGPYSYARFSTSTISVNAGPRGRAPVDTELQGCRPGLPPSQSLRELVLLALARGAMEWELASPASSSSTATGPRYTRIPAHRSTDHSSTYSAARSATSVGG
jgi:hypothetical protein